MKTIVEGNKDKLKEYKYFECKRCGWVGKADKTEYSHEEFQLKSYYKVACPTCGDICYSIQNKDRLEEIKNIEKLKTLDFLQWNGSQGKIGEFK